MNRAGEDDLLEGRNQRGTEKSHNEEIGSVNTLAQAFARVEQERSKLGRVRQTEGFVYWTLWDWKKRLGIEPARPANGQKKSNNQKAANKPEFLPVQIIDHSRELLTTHQESRSSAVELIVARDYTMRFDENCALDFVSRVVTMLEER